MTERIKTFDSVLVANRGEIAVRILTVAKQLGLRTVAVYSEVDRGALHVKLADKAIKIGEGPADESYLSIPKIISIAKQEKVGAIHPGYGFLSENPDFARECHKEKINFIGPSPETIMKMGNKAEAKNFVSSIKVPCLAGAALVTDSFSEVKKISTEIGFPLMIKAAAGGGGVGMRLVKRQRDLKRAMILAKTEALKAFDSDKIILERAILSPKHIEVQIFGDTYGNVIHLGERDCSIQRRHQKIVEEAPCSTLTSRVRDEIGRIAIEIGKKLKYVGAGTVEFLLDKSENFFFLEMNTRIQVEHPVTELITGIDLIQLQFLVADGQRLPIEQGDVILKGHAIEVRLYAEDPSNDFLPSSGKINLLKLNPTEGVRIDRGVEEGNLISAFYDPLIAKIIGHGETREKALHNLQNCLETATLIGVKNNRNFLIDILNQESMLRGQVTTSFLDVTYSHGFCENTPKPVHYAVVAVLIHTGKMLKHLNQTNFISDELVGWASSDELKSSLTLKSGGETKKIFLRQKNMGSYIAEIGGTPINISINGYDIRVDGEKQDVITFFNDGQTYTYTTPKTEYIFHEILALDTIEKKEKIGVVCAPMHGLIANISIKLGDNVKRGDRVIILEAMKMQHELLADIDGKVTEISCVAGDQVSIDDILVKIK